jgi:hypothetical protein
MTAFVRRLAALAIPLAVIVHARAASADVRACVAASDRAQQLRDDGKLKLARQELLVCGSESCPAIVRKDCATWLAAVDASLPSVVLSARDATGRDLTDVRVSLDDGPLVASLDGKAVAIDPGPHVLRFEAPDQKPVEARFVIREGEQRRAIEVQFPPPEVKPVPLPLPREVPLPREAPAPPRPVPVASIVLGAIGVAAFASFAGFGIAGKNELANLHATCGVMHDCSNDAVDATRLKLIVADASLATGIVAIATGTVLFFVLRPTSSPAAPRGALAIGATPIAGGGAVAGTLRF